ncbi:DsbA family oxidoreductase [Xenophilus arseniciresistens]|uniref:DsbA family oxidoreductase n=1 Tax=Xenophilus arseniciresistens TaxID=1283306 RepID=A0AAE3ND59_9BURK|nr:DsbA family oxidoreductase [Xenophilus arseniciresistens]MDA7417434.1 DsbA family oxidoreductase [Xenophilus arseniciresistens]
MSTPANDSTALRIDFVSDVSCPWCAVGLASLQQAMARVAPQIEVELHFQPFELNPQMGPEGEDSIEHLQRKYGISEEQVRANGEALRQRGEAVGFPFNLDVRKRVWNTFDAHRLLHWAGTVGGAQQLALKQALLRAYFIEGLSPSDHAVLLQKVQEAGLDEARAQQILASDEFAEDVRQDEAMFTQAGIHSVPAVIINRQHLISGGQPPEVFERALRQIAGAQPPAVMSA